MESDNTLVEIRAQVERLHLSISENYKGVPTITIQINGDQMLGKPCTGPAYTIRLELTSGCKLSDLFDSLAQLQMNEWKRSNGFTQCDVDTRPLS